MRVSGQNCLVELSGDSVVCKIRGRLKGGRRESNSPVIAGDWVKVEQYGTEEYIIKGCQSQVWLHADFQNGNVIYTADSDAIMTKGIIALLVRTFSNQQPNNIVNANTDFIDQIGLKEQLSPTRANGLLSMVKQMKLYALAFQSKNTNAC